MAAITLAEVRAWDKQDPLRRTRAAFSLPAGVIYLDGNSLGPLPRATVPRLDAVVRREWGAGLIRSWDDAGWMAAPARIGAKIARIVGADADEVIVADSTSVNLFKLLAAAARLRPGRRKIVLEAGSFPTDRHVAEGVAALLPGCELAAVPPGALPAAIDEDTAVVLLCDVHYRSGARHDMAALTAAAHAAGALAVWDLSHSVGAVPVDLHVAGADMAVGCGYKFLNGGPGAPAFLFVARHLQAAARSPLQGWIGHAAPFAFADNFAPADGIARFQTGTPGVLGLAALEAGVDLFLATDPALLWQKSARLFDLFAARAAHLCPSLALLTPRAAAARGSHIAFRHGAAAPVMRGLIARGVIGDFRPPDVMRFGLTPLYTRFEDVWRAVGVLADVLGQDSTRYGNSFAAQVIRGAGDHDHDQQGTGDQPEGGARPARQRAGQPG
jgi:kynureninase